MSFRFAFLDMSPSEDTIAKPDIGVDITQHYFRYLTLVFICVRIASQSLVRTADQFLYEHIAVTMKHSLEGRGKCHQLLATIEELSNGDSE